MTTTLFYANDAVRDPLLKVQPRAAVLARSARRSIRAMAMLPSPTLEATPLIDPDRTSPAGKTPGVLVSSSIGSQSSG